MRIVQDAGSEVDGDRVDGEVAPRQIFLDRSGEADRIGPPPVGVAGLRAERRDLEPVAAEQDRHRAVADAGGYGATVEALHLLGRRVGGDVPVIGRPVLQQVSDRAADQVGGMPGVDQNGGEAPYRGGH